jgi:TPR repeat protein
MHRPIILLTLLLIQSTIATAAPPNSEEEMRAYVEFTKMVGPKKTEANQYLEDRLNEGYIFAAYYVGSSDLRGKNLWGEKIPVNLTKAHKHLKYACEVGMLPLACLDFKALISCQNDKGCQSESMRESIGSNAIDKVGNANAQITATERNQAQSLETFEEDPKLGDSFARCMADFIIVSNSIYMPEPKPDHLSKLTQKEKAYALQMGPRFITYTDVLLGNANNASARVEYFDAEEKRAIEANKQTQNSNYLSKRIAECSELYELHTGRLAPRAEAYLLKKKN